MYKKDDVLEAARAVRPYITELLGAEAEVVDLQLAQFLAEAKTGRSVDNQILGLLASHEPTREWLSEFLADKMPPQVTRGYPGRPPGVPTLPGTVRYVCPEGDFTVYREAIPATCPTHGLALVRVEPS